MARILIADDHAVVRRGLALILREEFERVRIGEAKDARETLEQVSRHAWDLVLLDINMPGRSGLELLEEIRRLRANLPVLVLSASPEAEFAVRALRTGAAGYINKQHASEEIVSAITKVLAGGTYVSAAVAETLALTLRLPAATAPHEQLSNRELQVFRLIALGKSVKQIAAELSLSEKTVSTYVGRIKQKTGLRTPVEITRYAIQHKLVE